MKKYDKIPRPKTPPVDAPQPDEPSGQGQPTPLPAPNNGHSIANAPPYRTGYRLGNRDEESQRVIEIDAHLIGLYIHKGNILSRYQAGGGQIFYHNPATGKFYAADFDDIDPDDLVEACLQYSNDDQGGPPGGGAVALLPIGSIIKLGTLCTCQVGPGGISSAQSLIPTTLAYLLTSAPPPMIAAFVKWVLATDDALDDLEENDRIMLLAMLPQLALRWEQLKAEEGPEPEEDEPEAGFAGEHQHIFSAKLRLLDRIQQLIRRFEMLQAAGGVFPEGMLQELITWEAHLDSLLSDTADWWPPELAQGVHIIAQQAEESAAAVEAGPADAQAFQANYEQAKELLEKARNRFKHARVVSPQQGEAEQKLAALGQSKPSIGNNAKLIALLEEVQALSDEAERVFARAFGLDRADKAVKESGALNVKQQSGINPKSALQLRIKNGKVHIAHQNGNMWVITQDAWNAVPDAAKPRFLAALAAGPVAAKGMSGIKKYHDKPYTYELKILGAGGDMRILGIEINGVVYFDKFDPHAH